MKAKTNKDKERRKYENDIAWCQYIIKLLYAQTWYTPGSFDKAKSEVVNAMQKIADEAWEKGIQL